MFSYHSKIQLALNLELQQEIIDILQIKYFKIMWVKEEMANQPMKMKMQTY